MNNQTVFVESLSGVNVSNGIVKLFFGSQDGESAAKAYATGEAPEMKPAHTIALPMSGFLQAASTVNNLLNEPNMKAQIQRLIDAGVITLVAKEQGIEEEAYAG